MSVLLLAGCSPQTTKRLVSDYVKSTINNPDSYVPISFTAPVPTNAGDMLTGMGLTEAAPGAAMIEYPFNSKNAAGVLVTTSAHFYVDSVGKKADTVEHWQELEAAKLEKKLVDITKDQFGQ